MRCLIVRMERQGCQGGLLSWKAELRYASTSYGAQSATVSTTMTDTGAVRREVWSVDSLAIKQLVNNRHFVVINS